MRHDASSASLEQDEFLRAPALFKYGPASLVTAGVVLSLATLLAGEWRVVEGRKGEYDKAFVTARVAAGAATENFNLLEERLWHASREAETLQLGAADEAQMRRRLEQGLRAPSPGVQSFAVTRSGLLLGIGAASEEAAAHASEVMGQAAIQAMDRGAELFVPGQVEPGRAQWTAVIHRLDHGSRLAYVVHLLPASALLQVAERTLGPLIGRVVILDRAGRQLLQASNVNGPLALTAPDPSSAVVQTSAEAMGTDLNFASSRMLSASVQGAGHITAAVGLRESDVLREFKARVSATWLIIGLASACWMGLAALVAYALSKFKRTEAYLRRLATTDILTGLPNRRSFQTLLTKCVRRSEQRQEPLALLLLDLDNFKYVNDSMGHPVGDDLLKHVAALLARTLPAGDHVCRLGGDEFTFLAAGVDTVSAAQLLGERLLGEVRTLFASNGIEIEIKGSMGVALMPLHATTGTDLMRFADTALYRAKQEGKSRCVVYDDSMDQQSLVKAQTVRELARGIAHDELFLVYQPKYHLASGSLTGHEALVRWKHPTRGQVFPNEFIPLAEASGLIAELGDWVLQRAVRQVREWQEEGHGWHKVAVNVSQIQLRSNAFVAMVERVLRENRVPGRCLQLEITESCLASDVERLRSLVRELRSLGVTIAVDDFGTGYSSLCTLGQFDIDTLKVDRSFIDAILTLEGLSICRAIVSLGHSLEMSIVAEGVENAEQASALANLGCNEVQGYLYSRPVAPEVAVTLLAATPSLPVEGTRNVPPDDRLGRRPQLSIVQ
jgi:diguanylate cyclase (GGDEF)-like protein